MQCAPSISSASVITEFWAWPRVLVGGKAWKATTSQRGGGQLTWATDMGNWLKTMFNRSLLPVCFVWILYKEGGPLYVTLVKPGSLFQTGVASLCSVDSHHFLPWSPALVKLHSNVDRTGNVRIHWIPCCKSNSGIIFTHHYQTKHGVASSTHN